MASQSAARAFLWSELAKFARAGFGIAKACQSILGQPGSDRVARAICGAILAGTREGKSIADSLDHPRGPATPLEVSMVDAAERGGKLELGFRHLATHFRQEADARRRIRRAMAYPVILLHFALAAGIGVTALLRAVDPVAPASGGWAGAAMPGLVAAGIGYALALALALGWRWASAAAESSAAADAWLHRVPLAGPARRSAALARFSEVLHLYLLSGQRMDLAWRRAGEASRSGRLNRFAAGAAKRLGAGESVSEVASGARGALPGDFARSLASADLAGALDEETGRWAQTYREATAESMERLAEWSPKLFYWFVLAIAAWMVIRVALAYRGILQNLLDWNP